MTYSYTETAVCLSVRSQKALGLLLHREPASITPDLLTEVTGRDIVTLPGIGRKSFNEINEWLAANKCPKLGYPPPDAGPKRYKMYQCPSCGVEVRAIDALNASRYPD